MARSNFDFSHTCPKIDKAIDSAKDGIENRLINIIESLCPHIPETKVEELAREWAGEIYNDIKDCFESVRETNKDMRKAAEDQINTLADEVDQLKYELDQVS